MEEAKNVCSVRHVDAEPAIDVESDHQILA